ncbi:MAG: magnesium-translocating P-type ATPase [Candidatus ainarchaeum sp.]|nr:magnesium-translocating P-type ATPase [Candidatus ainarchaeum sp.]
MPGFEAMTAAEAVGALGSDSSAGLSSREAGARLAARGRNELGGREKRGALKMFLGQFANPLVLILVFASAVSGVVGEFTEAGVIVGILAISAALGFVQEYRGEKALEKLSRLLVSRAKVLRDGGLQEVDARLLVPGDVVHIETGDVVPADLRLLHASGLAVNQSVLTGESAPAEKNAEPLPSPAPSLQDRACVAFMGTSVASGGGAGLVIATGRETEIGKTAKLIREAPPETDFGKGIKRFGELLVALIAAMTMFIFFVNAYLGKDVFVSLVFALAIAVGIAPELLPMIITISLSSGAMALAKKKVVVKRLDAIEDLGNVDVLCTDKTGTLTENAIALQGHEDAEGRDDPDVLFKAMLASPVAIGIRHRYAGMAIDSAVWEHAKTVGKLAKRAAEHGIVGEVPFDYERRMMSVVTREGAGALMVSKGSPESVIPRCSAVRINGAREDARNHSARLMRRYEELSRRGFRVIAVAEKSVPVKGAYSAGDESGLEFLGFLLFSDPPRKSAMEALGKLKRLGVEVKLLSGDEPHVTLAVCEAVGLEVKGGKPVSGQEIEGLSDEGLRGVAEEANVFARLTPTHKLRIVEALRQNGRITGFIGDGVNDAPALRAADCGISVDTGTGIAKESADIILMAHGLSAVADGISEGRKTFANTVKYIKNTISANFGNMFTLAVSSMFLPFLPLLPSQILLNNFVSDIPMTAVSTDRVDESELRMPRKWRIGNIARFMVFFGLVSSVFDLVTMAFLIWFINSGFSLAGLGAELRLDDAGQKLFRTGWFVESAVSEIIVVFSIRTALPFWKSRPSSLLLAVSAAAVAASAALLYSPLAPAFEFAQPGFQFMAVIAAILVAYFLVAELSKHAFYRFVQRP